MTWWLFIPVMVLATMLVGIVATLAARAHPAIRAAATACSLSAVAIPVSVVLHNVLSSWIGDDEGITFVFALLIAPAAFATGSYLVSRALRTDRSASTLARGFVIAASGVFLMVVYILFAFAVTIVLDGAVPYQATVEAIVLPAAAVVTSFGAVMAAIALARENMRFA